MDQRRASHSTADTHDFRSHSIYAATAPSFRANKAAGLVSVSDPIKASTPDAIRELKAAGLTIIMVTGDNATTARAVAYKLGIEFEADVLSLKGKPISSESTSSRVRL